MKEFLRLVGQILAGASGVIVIAVAIAAGGNLLSLCGLIAIAGYVSYMSPEPWITLRQGVLALIVNALLVFAILQTGSELVVFGLLGTWLVALNA